MCSTQEWRQSLRIAGLLAGVLPLLAGGCGGEEGTSEFAPVYVAVAYGKLLPRGYRQGASPSEPMSTGVRANPSFAPSPRRQSFRLRPEGITQSFSTATIRPQDNAWYCSALIRETAWRCPWHQCPLVLERTRSHATAFA